MEKLKGDKAVAGATVTCSVTLASGDRMVRSRGLGLHGRNGLFESRSSFGTRNTVELDKCGWWSGGDASLAMRAGKRVECLVGRWSERKDGKGDEHHGGGQQQPEYGARGLRA